MEKFGEEVEKYIIENGISAQKIQLEWVEQTTASTQSTAANDYEIFITVDSTFTLVE